MSEAWDCGIASAVRNARIDPVRIYRKEYVNKIDDEIVIEIRRSRFFVAGFTHGDTRERGVVCHEAGIPHGRGIPVLFSCRRDRLAEVHFDTRQYHHIVWETPENMRIQPVRRISAALGGGLIEPPDTEGVKNQR